MTAYLDASVILRVLLGEPGPSVQRQPDDEVFSTEVVEVEVFRALDRARVVGRLTDDGLAVKSKEASDYLATVRLVPVSHAVIVRARATFPVVVRALDALHVATAEWLHEELGQPLDFWTHDARQGRAALCRALDVRGLS